MTGPDRPTAEACKYCGGPMGWDGFGWGCIKPCEAFRASWRAAALAGTAPAEHGLLEVEDALTEAIENLIFAAEELRDHSVSAASFWDEYVGPAEKDHPSDACFRNLRDAEEINSAISDVRAALAVAAPAAPQVCQHCGGKGYTDCPTNKGETHCCPYCLGGAPAAPAPTYEYSAEQQFREEVAEHLAPGGAPAPEPTTGNDAAADTVESATRAVDRVLARAGVYSLAPLNRRSVARMCVEAAARTPNEMSTNAELVVGGGSAGRAAPTDKQIHKLQELLNCEPEPTELDGWDWDVCERLLTEVLRAAPPPGEAARG